MSDNSKTTKVWGFQNRQTGKISTTQFYQTRREAAVDWYDKSFWKIIRIEMREAR